MGNLCSCNPSEDPSFDSRHILASELVANVKKRRASVLIIDFRTRKTTQIITSQQVAHLIEFCSLDPEKLELGGSLNMLNDMASKRERERLNNLPSYEWIVLVPDAEEAQISLDELPKESNTKIVLKALTTNNRLDNKPKYAPLILYEMEAYSRPNRSNGNRNVRVGQQLAVSGRRTARQSTAQSTPASPTLSGHELLIQSGQKGFSYDRILNHEGCLKDAMMAVQEIEIVEPYLLQPHQMNNLTYFCQLLARRCSRLQTIRLKTLDESRQQVATQLGHLQRALRINLCPTYHQRHALHDRQVVFSGTGWRVRWDRGLDIYKDRGCTHLSEADFSRRACKEVRIHYLFDQRQ